jgi:hypothetical protein
VLNEVSTAISTELTLTRDLTKPLQEIVDNYSQWSFRLYLANLSRSPFLVRTNAFVEIRDKSGGHYTEPCFLLLLQDEKGKRRRVRSESPVVSESESDLKVDFVTAKTQVDMTAGDTLRAMFNAGSAECRLSFQLERPGHWRQQVVKTTWVKFVDSRPSAA